LSAPYKTILCIDFETKWSSKPTDWSPQGAFTLSKMTTEEYIRDSRFEVFGACIRELGDDRAPQWYRGDELPRILATHSIFSVSVFFSWCRLG